MATKAAVNAALLRARRKALGQCISCDKPVVINQRCDVHVKLQRAYSRAWYLRKLAIPEEELKAYKTKRNQQSKQRREKLYAQKICVRCRQPNDSGKVDCKACQKIKNDQLYHKNKRYGERQPEKDARYKRTTLADMQYQLGEHWLEDKEWVVEHWELFRDKPDPILLYKARPFTTPELAGYVADKGFIDESSSHR